MPDSGREIARSADWDAGNAPPQNPLDWVSAGQERFQRHPHEAFGLAKAGSASRGFLLLRAGRAQAESSLPPNNQYTEELLHRWDAALRSFERFAPSPLD